MVVADSVLLSVLLITSGVHGAGPDRIATTPHFAFESSALINLHHFLYQWARHDAPPPGRRMGRLIELPERAELASLPEDARTQWERAVALYGEHALAHDLLFDEAMIAFRNRLAAEGMELEPTSEMEGALIETLRDALPLYEEHWWPAHAGANHTWVEGLLPLLERYEETLAAHIADAYGGHWPEGTVRIDVCAHANWAKAYTAGNHAVISSMASVHQGYGALEVLFHEASHTPGIARALREGIYAAFEEVEAPPPRDLWHVVMFHTAGDAVERTLAADPDLDLEEPYVHLGTRNGVYERGSEWPRLYAAVLEHWQPSLDGSVDRKTANAHLAQALAAR